MTTLNDLIQQCLHRVQEATLGVLDVNNNVRQALRQIMSQELGNENCFIADPVIEHTFDWKTSEFTFQKLSQEGLLSPELLKVLNHADNGYAFKSTSKPYIHQLQAWRHLLEDQAKSAIITSGTGSGKTECFMIPILEDLIRRQKHENTKLIGVQALFLYPLNALINSQRERLNAWTKPFGERIRYCLYNGNTKEKDDTRDSDRPNEIQSREKLRREPPPILMTNATMLEYMLVRNIDAPIILKSKQAQSLRWIVLDEAHSYIGSHAAEIALLLRRVIHAFGKKPDEIRFVATSATLASAEAEKKLQQYLANLARISTEQVAVISGERKLEHIPIGAGVEKLEEISVIDKDLLDKGVLNSAKRYQALANHTVAGTLRQSLLESKLPLTLNQLVNKCASRLFSGSLEVRQREVLDWLELMTKTLHPDTGQPFLKLRMHLFQSELNGLWACVDRNCSHKNDALGDWGFGQIYLRQRNQCQCGAPVFELVPCRECGGSHLLATIATDTAKLVQYDFVNRENNSVLLAPVSGSSKYQEKYHPQKLDKRTAELGVNSNSGQTIDIAINFLSAATCSDCGYEGREEKFYFFKHQKYGRSLYVPQIVPTVLDFCAESKQNPADLPARGRRLITFTDSRQGTARMAVKMQQEAEASKLRGWVFQKLVEDRSGDILSLEKRKADKEEYQRRLETMTDDLFFRKLLKDKLKDMEKEEQNTCVPWEKMVEFLSNRIEMQHLLEYNREVDGRYFGQQVFDAKQKLTEILLLREFMNRPRGASSLETLGLAAVVYPGLDKINSAPGDWTETKVVHTVEQVEKFLDLEDWKTFLKVLLDFYVRGNSCIRFKGDYKRWLGRSFFGHTLVWGKDKADEGQHRQPWPQIAVPARVNVVRPIKILQAVTGWDLNDRLAQQKINEWLECAWQQLTETASILMPDNDEWAMPVSKMAFRLPEKAWLCPRTHTLIDNTLCGVTPYLSLGFREMSPEQLFCQEVQLPDYTQFKPDSSSEPRRIQMRRKISEDERIQILRDLGVWNNLQDQIVEGGFYYRTAEHSAQISAEQLGKYEEQFKAGKINVLSCSTTMEMGVDIGGMAAVVMNNVPPHPANYLQRTGRAGRRSETAAVAYTLCGTNPHNNFVFNNPLWPFKAMIAPPQVSLNSEKIIIRHVHSLMLSEFFKQAGMVGDGTKLNTRWFFDPKKSVWQQFCNWIKEPCREELDSAIHKLLQKSVLETASLSDIKKQAEYKLAELSEVWMDEYDNINTHLQKARQSQDVVDRYKKALEKEKSRHENENLLGFLAVHNFLPSYGFPTGVVDLRIIKMDDRSHSDREDNLYARKEAPRRSLDIALREYVPGARVVVDGQVYRSAGINLRVKTDGQGPNDTQRLDTAWECPECHTVGVINYKYSIGEIVCYRCGHTIPNDDKYKQTVLTPTGFLTDFFEETNNNVSSEQSYMPVEASIELRGEASALIQPACGEIRYGGNGEVFFKSEGRHRHGYAVCFQCGRSDSMSEQNKIPDKLNHKEVSGHSPLGGGLEISKKEKICSNQKVHEGIFLGYRTRTDVLEILMKNPDTGKWLDNLTVATTIAVAVRDEIAAFLGVESDEVGYAIRMQGDACYVIQLYDRASGGAGFVLAVLSDINDILLKAFDRLECPQDCEKVCPYCLASGDINVGENHIDRRAALNWLKESQFRQHFKLPENVGRIPDNQYVFCPAVSEIEKMLSEMKGSKLLLYVYQIEKIWCSPDTQVRLMQWSKFYQVEPIVCLTQSEWLQRDDLRKLFLPYVRAGWKIAQTKIGNVEYGVSLCAQLIKGKKIWSLFSEHPTEVFAKAETALFSSEMLPENSVQFIDTSSWHMTPAACRLLRFNRELDGELQNFGDRLLVLIEKQSPVLSVSSLTEDPIHRIHYMDSYFRSPAALLLLSTILYAIQKQNGGNAFGYMRLTVEKACILHQSSRTLWHHWQNGGQQKALLETWFTTSGIAKFTEIDTNSDPKQGAILEMLHQSGKKTLIKFDHGMDYWQIQLPKHREILRFYPFEKNSAKQVKHLEECWASGIEVESRYDWETYITIESRN